MWQTEFHLDGLRLDAVDRERSVLSRCGPANQPFEVFLPPGPLPVWPEGQAENPRPSKLVVKRSVIKGHHLWRDARIVKNYFVSDELAAAIKAASLKGFKPKKIAESD
jgi:hypothetical protein